MTLITNHAKSLLKTASSPFVNVRVYIKDNNGAWVDFSQSELEGMNRVLSISPIKHTVEKDFGVLSTESSGITLRNDDGFFSKPFPHWMTTVGGASASWSLTTNKSRSVIYRHQMKLTFRVQTLEHTWEEYPLGVFLCDKMVFDHDKQTVKLNLIGQAKELMERDASKVKNGRSWYTNRPAKFLVQELLKLSYQNTSGGVPAEYNFEDVITIPTYDGALVVSHYGRPPEWNGSVWQSTGQLCRAIDWGTVNGSTGLFLSLDEAVWRFDPTTDTYTQIDSSVYASEVVEWMRIIDGNIWVATIDGDASNYTNLRLASSSGAGFTSRVTNGAMWRGKFLFRHGSVQVPVTYEYRIFGNNLNTDYNWQIDRGDNTPVPFAQMITEVSGESTANTHWQFEKETIDDYDDTDETGDFNHADSEYKRHAKGWMSYVSKSYTAGTSVAQEVRYSLGNPLCICYSPYGNGRICYFSVSTAYVFTLRKFDTTTYTETTKSMSGVMTDPDEQVLCMCSGTGASYSKYIYFGTHEHVDNETGGPGSTSISISHLYYHDQNADTLNELTYLSGATGNDLYWDVLELEWNQSSNKLVGCLFNRKTMQYMFAYDLAVYAWSGVTKAYTGAGQIKGLRYDPTTYKVYGYEVGSGRIVAYDNTGAFEIIDNGTACVNNETNLSCHKLAWGTVDGDAVGFGVSSPSHDPITQENIADGKYYLFTIAPYLTDRIELADFSDMDAWEAIKNICMAVYCTAGFDESGNFFMKKRDVTVSGTDDFQIGTTQTLSQPKLNHHAGLSEDSGEDEIYNYASIVPFEIIKKPPEAELMMVKRPLGTYSTGDSDVDEAPEDVPFIDFEFDHRDNMRKTVRAVCVQAGKSDDGTSRWKYATYDTTIETHLVTAATSAATTYYLSSLFGGNSTSGELNDLSGVQIGDFAQIISPTDDSVILRKITNTDPAAISITVASTFGVALGVGHLFDIIKLNSIDSGSSHATWSDDGVTYATGAAVGSWLPVASVSNLSAYGTYVRVETSAGVYVYGGRVTAVDYANSKIYIDGIGTSGASGNLVKAYWSPTDSNDFYIEIGGSKAFVKFHVPTSGEENKNWTRTFAEGDILTITCYGLEAQPDDQSKQTAINMVSVGKYGTRQYQDLSNRFISRRASRHFAGKIVSEHKDPKPLLTYTGLFNPEVTVVTTSGNLSQVRLYDPTAFPLRGHFSEPCIVRSVQHDVRKRSTTFVLKSLLAQ